MVVLRVTEEERCSALGAHSGVTPGNYLSSLKRQGTSVTENICAGVTLERVLGVLRLFASSEFVGELRSFCPTGGRERGRH